MINKFDLEEFAARFGLSPESKEIISQIIHPDSVPVHLLQSRVGNVIVSFTSQKMNCVIKSGDSDNDLFRNLFNENLVVKSQFEFNEPEQVDRPYITLEIDHTDLDLIEVDPSNQYPLGRVILEHKTDDEHPLIPIEFSSRFYPPTCKPTMESILNIIENNEKKGFKPKFGEVIERIFSNSFILSRLPGSTTESIASTKPNSDSAVLTDDELINLLNVFLKSFNDSINQDNEQSSNKP
jgi:hypothetical protein